MNVEREAPAILGFEAVVELIMQDIRREKEEAPGPCITFTRKELGDLSAFLKRPATTRWVPVTTA